MATRCQEVDDMSNGQRIVTAACLALAVTAATAVAEPREVRVPLVDGRLSAGQLSRAVGVPVPLPTDDVGVDIRGVGGWVVTRALNKALGDGCSIRVAADALVVRYDTARLPRTAAEAKDVVQAFTATAADESTAAQARLLGLLLPPRVDESRPIVVLVHGLDCNRGNWASMAALLAGEALQPAYFTYPSDQPIERSAALLARHMAALRDLYPATPVHVIAHSMGGLVARAYVEGRAYAGGVDRLILIAPPNHGSRWARYRLLLEAREHYNLWQSEPDYSPTWAVTDGLGQAGADLMPGSEFITALNALPRRAGVRYTIITGDRHEGWRLAGDAIGSVEGLVPEAAEGWWGVRHALGAVDRLADRAREQSNGTDGPVAIDSARLDGVDDFVLLPADHTSLYARATEEQPAPIAWETIRERLVEAQ